MQQGRYVKGEVCKRGGKRGSTKRELVSVRNSFPCKRAVGSFNLQPTPLICLTGIISGISSGPSTKKSTKNGILHRHPANPTALNFSRFETSRPVPSLIDADFNLSSLVLHLFFDFPYYFANSNNSLPRDTRRSV